MMEIFVHFSWDPHRVYAFKPDGSYLDGWPVEVTDDLGHHPGTEAPSFCDIDNDRYKEICVSGRLGLYIYNHDGSFLKFISCHLASQPKTEVVFADLNNDGDFEIIKKYQPRDQSIRGFYLAVFRSNGTLLPGWPQMFYNTTEGGWIICGSGGSVPAVGNFDDDSDLEIVVASPRNVYIEITGEWEKAGKVHLFNLDGSILQGYPVENDGIIFSSPAVGDIDKDGYDDIVFCSSFYYLPNTGLYVLDRFGNNCAGWPQLVYKDTTISPALADFDGDGYLEIVAGSLMKPYNFYVFDYLGNVLPGWPQQTSWNAYRSPSIGDINGDGIPDILTTAGNGVSAPDYGDGGVYAWNIDGTLIEGFPKPTEMDVQAATTIADIDNDGILELIAGSNLDWDFTVDWIKYRSSIYIWELGHELNEVTMEWPMFHRDTMHTGYYALDFPIPNRLLHFNK
jgi:hypothetical protein